MLHGLSWWQKGVCVCVCVRVSTVAHCHGETSLVSEMGISSCFSWWTAKMVLGLLQQSQTNIYFLCVAAPVSWVHIEFLTWAWQRPRKVITYWMFLSFIQLLEGKIHLLRGPEIVWRNHVSCSPQSQPFTSTWKQVEHGTPYLHHAKLTSGPAGWNVSPVK